MTLFTALVAGSVVGVRHALEADHLAAVATLVEGERGDGYVGASWGVGHSVPVAGLGLLFVALGVRLPTPVTRFFEVVVGVVLVALGVRLLAGLAGDTAVERHSHGDGGHAHLRLGTLAVGDSHAHLDGDSFAVGLVHGVAGSGVLVVAMAATAPTLDAALAFLVAFSLCSTLTMATVALAWGRALGTGLTDVLRVLAALVGIGAGVLLLGQSAGVVPG